MSSIYDALQRIQGEKGSWTAPVSGEEQPPPPRKKTLWVILIAIIISSLCTAGVFFGIKAIGEEKPRPQLASQAQAAAALKAVPAPAQALPVPQMPAAAAAPAQSVAQPPTVHPDNVEDYLKLGEQYYGSKNYDKAVQTYTEAMHYYRKDARLLNNIGSVYLAMGQAGKAIHYLKEARDASRNYPEPVYNLACAYAAVGEKAKAISQLKLASTMNPQVRKWAASDPDLKDLKGNAEFDRIVGRAIREKGE